MKNFFLSIYQYFTKHKTTFAATLVATVALLAFFAAQIRFDENITGFFPNTNEETNFVMNNMQTMNRAVVAISQNQSELDIYKLIDAAEHYADTLAHCPDSLAVSLYYDDSSTEEITNLIFSHLPSFLTENELHSLDSLTTDETIAAHLAGIKNLLSNPMVSGVSEFIANDPLSFSLPALNRMRSIAATDRFAMIDGYIFDSSQRYLIMFVDLGNDFGETGNNSEIINYIRTSAQEIGEHHDVQFYIFGAPVVAVVNADQVKFDETWTVTLATIVICIVILLIFRRKRTIVLIVVSIAFGTLFALGIISMLHIELSLIAVGSGATILGIAMSYAIHMVTHSLHARSVRHLLSDMVYPMTVGSITTVGAFVGLMFTSSRILHDLGLFASLALVGTILFCLIFLPHFLTTDYATKPSRLRRFVNSISSYDYSRNKLIVIVIAIATIVGIFFFNDVKYSNDMSQLNYQGDEWLQQSTDTIVRLLDIDNSESTVAIVAQSINDLATYANDFNTRCDSLRSFGVNAAHSIAPVILIDSATQVERIKIWRQFWTDERKAVVKSAIERHSRELGFADGCFDNFFEILDADFEPYLPTISEIEQSSILKNYITICDDAFILNVSLSLDNDRRDAILAECDQMQGVVVTDLGYFVRQATDGIADDFNFILIISSALVALALLLSYGRIELFLLSFLPMCISWVIILGLMALCDIQFNVVSIILATFIFGVGDDFSIFIVDGLQSNYATGRRMLQSHKSAILLSGFAIIVGLGVQIFAAHPAVHSLGLLSILGLVAVILTAYVVQPLLFRIFVEKPAINDNPATFLSAFRTIFCFGVFGLICILSNIITTFIKLLPIGKYNRNYLYNKTIRSGMRFTRLIIGLFIEQRTIGHFDASHPQVVIANHQSFIDVLTLITLIPKSIVVTKTWVTRSPVYGHLVRGAGFYNVDNGHDKMLRDLRPFVGDGYSVIIFPEGSRSSDLQIHRFHKGAFLLAQDFNLPITPIIMMGNGMVAHKQHILTRNGLIINKIMPSINITKPPYNVDLKDVTKMICELMRKEYQAVQMEFNTTSNPYYTERLSNNYTYKLPYLERKIVRNLKRNNHFDFIDRHLTTDATIFDDSYGELTTLMAIRHNNLIINTYLYDDEKLEIAENGYLVKRENRAANRLNFNIIDNNFIDLSTQTFIVNTDKFPLVNLDNVRNIFIRDELVQNIDRQYFTFVKKADGWSLFVAKK